MTRALLLAIGLCGCGAPELELPEGPRQSALVVTLEPEALLDAAPSVMRIRVDGASDADRAGRWLVFSGELSSYHLGRIRRRDYPKTLLEREIGIETWIEEQTLVIAPGRVLESGASYSLASEPNGLVAALRVDSAAPQVFRRLWPERTPEGDVFGAELLVYCLADPSGLTLPLEPRPIALAPNALAATAGPGIDRSGQEQDRCVHIVLDARPNEGSLLLPPVSLDGVPFEPTPIRVPPEAAWDPLACESGEIAFGPGCALVQDDRLLIRPPPLPLLWVMIIGELSVFRVSGPGLPFVVRGLRAGTSSLASGVAYDVTGRSARFELMFETTPPQPHLILNEVLANPVGPEPQQEWVEIVNDGAAPVAVSGMTFEDVAGISRLPDVELGPGEYALLVGPLFDPLLGFDREPAPGTRLLRLEALGKSGLANGGEPLRLRDAGGAVLSSFPAFESPVAGVSGARIAPEAPDAVAASFALSAGDGASPGAPNTVAAP